jgi:hypothetical protein
MGTSIKGDLERKSKLINESPGAPGLFLICTHVYDVLQRHTDSLLPQPRKADNLPRRLIDPLWQHHQLSRPILVVDLERDDGWQVTCLAFQSNRTWRLRRRSAKRQSSMKKTPFARGLSFAEIEAVARVPRS